MSGIEPPVSPWGPAPVGGLVRALLAAGVTGACAIVAVVLARRGRRAADPVMRAWARTLLRLAAARVEARGVERLPPGPWILASNHQSNYDIPLLAAHLPGHVRFVAKRELFRIPLFGPALRSTGHLALTRTGSEQDRETLRQAASMIAHGVSFVFFPEGTRGEGSTLRPFKKGAAILALETGAPLVPAAISGTRAIMGKGEARLRAHCPVLLRIGEPLAVPGAGPGDRDRLTAELQAAVESLIGDRGAPPSGYVPARRGRA